MEGWNEKCPTNSVRIGMFNVCTLVLEGLGGCFDQPGIMNHCLSASVPLFLNSFFGTSRKKKTKKTLMWYEEPLIKISHVKISCDVITKLISDYSYLIFLIWLTDRTVIFTIFYRKLTGILFSYKIWILKRKISRHLRLLVYVEELSID